MSDEPKTNNKPETDRAPEKKPLVFPKDWVEEKVDPGTTMIIGWPGPRPPDR
jgi:hypothetical protein